MITKILFEKTYQSIIPQVWENVPPFAVISGLNGSGKSQLLSAIKQATESPGNKSFPKIESDSRINQRVKLLRAGFVPQDIVERNQSQNTASILERKRADFINRVKRTQNPKPGSAIEQVHQRFGGDVSAISDQDVISFMPNDLPLLMQDFFENQYIEQVFRNYLDRMTQYKESTYFDQCKAENDIEVHEKLGAKPPWDTINELFFENGFNYEISVPQQGVAYTPLFRDRTNSSVQVGFTALSTGEKIIVTLILWAYNSKQGEFTDVFLLDELDAHLNPSLSKMLIHILREKIVKEFRIQVILTTHSPSTVAYVEDDCLFWMERNKPIRQSSCKEIVPVLSDGIITIAPDKALRVFSSIVGEVSKPILCVEGVTDKQILECAWSKLYPNEYIPFEIHDVFDCYFLTNLFKRGEIFDNYPHKKFIGLVDFDDALSDLKGKLSEGKNRKKWSMEADQSDGSVTFFHENGCGVVLTLSIPHFRSDYASANMRNSYLSIELLFEDALIEGFCEEVQVAGGAKLLRFKDSKKLAFASQVETFDPSSFAAFGPLFDRLRGHV